MKISHMGIGHKMVKVYRIHPEHMMYISELIKIISKEK